jgi:hypothetical protein
MTMTERLVEGRDLFDALRANYAEGRQVWVQTTARQYADQLGVVPPVRQLGGGFLRGEPYDHDATGAEVYAAFVRKAGKYAACYMTAAEFRRLVG